MLQLCDTYGVANDTAEKAIQYVKEDSDLLIAAEPIFMSCVEYDFPALAESACKLSLGFLIQMVLQR